MAADIPTYEPSSIVAGDTSKWTRALGDYSYADGWRLRYEIRGASALNVDATADTDGIGHAATISAEDSAKLAAGQYQWFARVGYGGEVYTVDSGVLAVSANPSKAQAGDLVSYEEKQLAAVEKVLADLATNPHESYAIGSRSVTFRDIGEMERYAQSLRGRLARRRGFTAPRHDLVTSAAR